MPQDRQHAVALLHLVVDLVDRDRHRVDLFVGRRLNLQETQHPEVLDGVLFEELAHVERLHANRLAGGVEDTFARPFTLQLLEGDSGDLHDADFLRPLESHRP